MVVEGVVKANDEVASASVIPGTMHEGAASSRLILEWRGCEVDRCVPVLDPDEVRRLSFESHRTFASRQVGDQWFLNRC